MVRDSVRLRWGRVLNNSKDLLDFVSDVAGDRWLKVERDLGSGYVVLNASEAERRQARHDIRCVEDCVVEMLRNARDAGARHIFIAFGHKGTHRQVTVIDDGVGIPVEVSQAIFEPRVTSKLDNVVEDRYGVHGRGMALYSIRANVHSFELKASQPGGGAVFQLLADTERLTERKDQSTFPKLGLEGDEVAVTQGPRNALRAAVEFWLAHQSLNVYFGSNAEMLAALFAVGAQPTPDERGRQPLWPAVARATSANDLQAVAAQWLGFQVSERNCQRIFAGTIKPPAAIAQQVQALVGRHKGPTAVKPAGRKLASMFSDEDLQTFSQAIAENFRHLGQKYFLHLDADPRIRCREGGITIDLSVMTEDNW